MDLQCHVSLDQMSGGAGHEKVFALVDHEGVTDNLSQHPLLLNRVVAEKPLCSGEMVDQRLGGLMLRVILLQVLGLIGLHQHERLGTASRTKKPSQISMIGCSLTLARWIRAL